MTRIELGGQGELIPVEALPVGLGADTLTPITTIFTADDTFDKTIWESFGYTIFTIMCVGAAGGNGAFAWYILGAGTNAPEMITTCGGGGGGGGMHIVSGLIADIPDDISVIVVGEAGAHADRAWPGYSAYPVSYNDHGIDVGDPGEDGGYSAFGTVCKASGGKGGEVSPVVISSDPATSWIPGGNGGDGGIGNSIVAGGGGAGGSFVESGVGFHHAVFGDMPGYVISDGEQGFWNNVTGIGEGGGGGNGFTGGGLGVGSDAAWIPELPTAGLHHILSVHDTDLSAGGNGNFNYADSSKHGPKQSPGESFVVSSHIAPTAMNPYAVWAYTEYMPGGGGGARPTPLAKYGSRALGYSPNGIVIVRVA